MSDDKVFEGYLEGERPDDFETLSGFELAASYGGEGAERVQVRAPG